MTLFEIETRLQLLKHKELIDKDLEWCIIAIEFMLKGLKNQR